MLEYRKELASKKRIVIKIGTSSLTHESTGNLNLTKLEKLIRVLCDLRSSGKDIVLVTSGAIAIGRKTIGLKEKPTEISIRQACAAIGQGRLMMTYEKLFAEYNQTSAQILITKNTMINDISRKNAQNTFEKLFEFGIIPIVNNNDTVTTDELKYDDFGENDTLAAIVTALINADLLVLLSDIDGLYSDDPNKNTNVQFIEFVDEINEELINMGKGVTTNLGTGGMATKISAGRIATESGADMVIANGKNIDVINEIVNGYNIGTLFKAKKNKNFNLIDYLKTK